AEKEQCWRATLSRITKAVADAMGSAGPTWHDAQSAPRTSVSVEGQASRFGVPPSFETPRFPAPSGGVSPKRWHSAKKLNSRSAEPSEIPSHGCDTAFRVSGREGRRWRVPTGTGAKRSPRGRGPPSAEDGPLKAPGAA